MANKRRGVGGDEELNITSMMDMMTIILVFLLKSFSVTAVNVTPTDNLRLPKSNAEVEPGVAINVIVAKDEIVVDNNRILDVVVESGRYQIPKDQRKGSNVPKLFSEFEKAAKAAENLAKMSGNKEGMEFKGQIIFQIDKDIPYSLVRDVMYNAGQAKFSEFQFVVIKGE